MMEQWIQKCLEGHEGNLRDMGMVMRKRGRTAERGGTVPSLETLSFQFYFNKYKHPDLRVSAEK